MNYVYNGTEMSAREIKALNTNISYKEPIQVGAIPILPTPKMVCSDLERVVRDGVEVDAIGNTVEKWKIVNMFTTDLLDIDGVVIKTIAEQEAEYLSKLVATAKIPKVKLAYDKYETTRFADITYMSTSFQADAESQMLIVAVLSAGSVPDGFYWVDVTNSQVLMTYAELQGLSASILGRGQIAFGDYQTKKAEINACTTVAELDSVVI